jgi:hypothetical protein
MMIAKITNKGNSRIREGIAMTKSRQRFATREVNVKGSSSEYGTSNSLPNELDPVRAASSDSCSAVPTDGTITLSSDIC